MAWNVETTDLLIPLLFLLVGLTVTVAIDPYISKKHRIVMGIIIALSIALITQNLLEDWLAAGPPRWLWRTTMSIFGYTIRPIFLILFLYIVQPEKKHLPCWGLVILNGVLHLTAFFSPVVFHIDENNHYQGGPLHSIGYVISLILLGIWLFQSFRNYRTMRKRELLIPVLLVLMILVSVELDHNVGLAAQPVTFLTFCVVICSIFYYIWLHLRFVREHEDALKAQQRIQIMMTQIQPHFLFNTIATIRALCRRDPDKAGEVAAKFGDYLRQNLDSLDTVGLIPFQKELEHTKIYADIDMVRFDNVRVEYDIQDDQFSLPPLTVQPLVENAIRHGVRIREEGIVRVSSCRGESSHEIVVWDNGVGFNMAKIDAADSSHIGIRNVRERIEGMCRGSLKVESRIDVGTKVTITIPIQENPKEVSI